MSTSPPSPCIDGHAPPPVSCSVAMQNLASMEQDGVAVGADSQQPIPSSGRRTAAGDRTEQHPKDFFAAQFMQPEWITDVPPDLGANW